MRQCFSAEPGTSPWVHPIAGAIRAEVVADFEPHKDAKSGQLSLKIGEVVFVLERHESGWWGGHKEDDDLAGWFPSSAVQPTNDRLTGEQDCEPLVKRLCNELWATEKRISELEEKMKSLEDFVVKSLPSSTDVGANQASQQSSSRLSFEREYAAASVASIGAAPMTNQRSSTNSQPPKSSPAASQGQPPRPRNDSTRRAKAPKQIAVPRRAQVSEFERRSVSRTPSARHAEPSPRYRGGSPPSSRTASIIRAAVAAPVSSPAAAVSEQAEQPPRGRSIEAKVHEEERYGRGCGAEERSNMPVVFGMDPIPRSERSIARSFASPSRGLMVQDRIRQLRGGA